MMIFIPIGGEFRYELLAQAQRDLTAEQAARQLANQDDLHYRLRQSTQSSPVNPNA